MRFIYTLVFFLLFTLQAEGQTRGTLLPGNPAGPVRFYPNPAITQITFDFQGGYDKNYSFQIYSLLGKKVYNLPSIPASKTTIDLSDFFRGVYIFQLKDRNGKIVESGRFQVSK